MSKTLFLIILTFLCFNTSAAKEDLQQPLTKKDKLAAQKDINKRIKILADLKSCLKEGKNFKELKVCADSYIKKLEAHNEKSSLDKVNELKYF